MIVQAVPRRRLVIGIGVIALVLSSIWITNTQANADEPSATPVVYIVTGVNFPDALGVGPASALNRGPILMVTKTSIPTPTKNELSRLKPDHIVVVGGTAVISASVESQLAAWAPVSRIGGANRYETAALVSRAAFPSPPLGSGPTAAAAGGRYASGDDPTILVEDTITELGRLVITIPANGGVLNLTSSVMFETPDTSDGGYAWAIMTVDSACESDTAVASAGADLAFSWFGNIPLNASVSIGAGAHTVRLCGWAGHIDPADVTWVDAARLSAVWTPDAMGDTVSLSSASFSDS
ncbi:MAG: cell wall-binding repeat-containing protein, partial [Actinomycetia bacterium]|nr:cell wall-binding repeat-containing protein [Actinomycetes bacterium]